jgi:trehalose monomycolate/heme transporter
MFETFGRFLFRRRRWVLAAAAMFVAVAAVWGTGVFGSLRSAGFDDPDSESARAAKRAEQAFGRDEADVVVLYASPDLKVDDQAFRAAAEGTLVQLPKQHVGKVTTYWDTKAPPLVSADRHTTYAVLELAGADEEAREESLAAIRDDLAAPGLDTKVGGTVVVNSDINTQISEDIKRAEILSMPALLVLLVIVFGALAAAGMPLVVGGLAILGAFTALRLITLVTDVSVFAVNIVTMLGLGLAIDYALFMVTRFREELAVRRDGPTRVEDALARTVATAGRTVAFSGLTVAISLCGLLLFPQMFLRSMGFGGIAAVLVALVAALTVLPALLAVLGTRVNALAVPLLQGKGRRRRPSDGQRGAWHSVARSVMRRPVVYAVGIVTVLVALGLPFRNVVFGGIDARALPAGAESRVASDVVDREFPRNPATAINVVVDGASRVELPAYTERLGALPGVTAADVTGTAGDVSRIAIQYEADPISPAARDLVENVRETPGPQGADVLVGGQSAVLVDLLDSIGSTLPLMAVFVGLVTFVLLFLAFGSVVLPLKAMVMNLLSLTASFGALVWIFQDGNLSGPLGFTSTGTVEATQPILLLAVVFGLSMDYEVFMLSRVREQWDRTRDNTASVATGLQRTGGIITSAALLMVVVIGAFSTSGITFIKMLGIGMIVAIVVDATVVRALLVPAAMRLLGKHNWWAPAPLARFWDRYGHREESAPVPVVAAGPAKPTGPATPAGPVSPASAAAQARPEPASRPMVPVG